MTRVDLQTAQHELPQLIARALAGDEVVIATPAAGEIQLVPIRLPDQPALRQAGTAKGQIHMRDDFEDALPDFDDDTA